MDKWYVIVLYFESYLTFWTKYWCYLVFFFFFRTTRWWRLSVPKSDKFYFLCFYLQYCFVAKVRKFDGFIFWFLVCFFFFFHSCPYVGAVLFCSCFYFHSLPTVTWFVFCSIWFSFVFLSWLIGDYCGYYLKKASIIIFSL